MSNLCIGYDDNLGLPSDFTAALDCTIKPYHLLNEMIADFDAGKLSAMFIPSGTLPYITGYQIVAQSLFGPQHKTTLRTNFVSHENITLQNIPELKIGRVNQYCTTSFWAPLIYLMNHLPAQTSLHFKNTQSFPDMLHKAAETVVDAAMVWDIIMQQHPEDTQKVHELFYKQDLPSPIIVAKSKNECAGLEKLQNFTSKDSKAFFQGFKTPDLQTIQQFVTDMNAAQKYFQIVVS